MENKMVKQNLNLYKERYEMDELALNIIVLKHSIDCNNDFRSFKKKTLENYNK